MILNEGVGEAVAVSLNKWPLVYFFYLVAVLKSNYANGLFGFDGSCQPSSASMSDSQFVCTVKRDKGTYDTVTVTWRISSLKSAVSNYFSISTGTLVFGPGQTRMASSLWF